MGLEMKYFVLKPKSKHKNDQYAAASRAAMRAYALCVKNTDPSLSQGILSWARKEQQKADKLIDQNPGFCE